MKISLEGPEALEVTAHCARRRLRFSSCHACADVCSAQALTISSGRLEIDPSKCTGCGECLFACPAQAIRGVSPIIRYISGQALVAPFSATPPGVEEMLLWHREYSIRYIAMHPEKMPGWMLNVARLNLRLRLYGEPSWSFTAPEENEILAGRRAFLRAKRDNVSAVAVPPGKRRLRNLYPNYQDYSPVIDRQRCSLCLACVRVCAEKVFRLEQGEFKTLAACCSGCGDCAATCLQGAIDIKESVEPAMVAKMAVDSRECLVCRQAFFSFSPGETRCPLCRQHSYGMRG